jgi:hypothetical protein
MLSGGEAKHAPRERFRQVHIEDLAVRLCIPLVRREYCGQHAARHNHACENAVTEVPANDKTQILFVEEQRKHSNGGVGCATGETSSPQREE